MSIKGGNCKDKARFGKILVTLAAVALLLIPAAAAQGALLFPLQLGGYYSYDGSDGAGHTWNSKIEVVAQNISLNGQTYFHIRQKHLDPYDLTRANPRDMLMRCTDTQAYMSMGGSEALQFQIGPTSTPPWTTLAGDSASITADSLTVNVPYPPGTFNPVYENKFVSPVPGSQPWYAYLYPNLGLIKQTDYWVDPGRAPAILSLREAGVESVSLMPLKTGNRFTYNASDNLGNNWQMRVDILGQVTTSNGKTYFRARQTNYDPIGGDTYRLFYIRCTTNELYISFDGVTERLEFQIAGPLTAWNFPEPPGTIYKQITSIEPVNVLGGSFLAYKHQAQYKETGYESPFWYDYVVPALGVARTEDYNISNPSRAPLIFELVKMEERGNAGPALMLLLGNEPPL